MHTALQVVTPPAVEPVEIGVVAQHCRIDNGADDALLPVYLATARTLAEKFLNRALITQTLRWTMQRQPGVVGDGAALDVRSIGWTWGHGRTSFELPRAPIQSVTSVVVRDRNDVDTTLVAGTDYVVDTDLEPARIRLQPSSSSIGYIERVQTVFIAGYGADAGKVPTPIVNAILLMTAWLYEHRGDVEGEMPRAAEALLWNYRVTHFGG